MRSRRWLGALVACSCLMSAVSSAEPFPVLKGDYFGQTEPGARAVRFAEGLISQPGRHEFALNFSPSGDELLFTQQFPEQSAAVYHSRVEAGRWTEPGPVKLSGGAKAEEMEAFFSPDRKHIYFAPYDEGMDVRIWSLDISEQGWTNPRELGPVVDAPAFYPTASLDGTVYYTNLKERRIFRAQIADGSVSGAEDAGIEFGGHAYISPDGTFVLLDARTRDSLGESDIYVAFRQSDGSWQSPRNLGSEVNSSFAETCPSLSADGRFLFFSRYDEEREISDIYWIDAAVIDAAKVRVDARECFRKLTELSGSWTGSGGSIGADPSPTRHDFAVVSGGTTVMEIMDPEGEREINLYHLEGDDLVLTHYCGAGNQPRLRLDLEKVSQGVLPFGLAGGFGFDPEKDRHIHTSRLVIRQDDRLESRWTAEKAGEVVMESCFELTRDQGSAAQR